MAAAGRAVRLRKCSLVVKIEYGSTDEGLTGSVSLNQI